MRVAAGKFSRSFQRHHPGVIDLRDLVYFLSVIIAFLAANAILVDLKKAE